MDVVHHLLVLFHLVGFAALLGGCLVQLRNPEPEINAAMLHGAWVEVVTGAALWWLASRFGEHPALVRMIVSLVVNLFITLLVIRNRRYLLVPRGLLVLITLLTLALAALAVFGPG